MCTRYKSVLNRDFLFYKPVKNLPSRELPLPRGDSVVGQQTCPGSVKHHPEQLNISVLRNGAISRKKIFSDDKRGIMYIEGSVVGRGGRHPGTSRTKHSPWPGGPSPCTDPWDFGAVRKDMCLIPALALKQKRARMARLWQTTRQGDADDSRSFPSSRTDVSAPCNWLSK